jgi:mannose-6-phosphate isomerase-like protein (cupin superfamily)
MTSKQRTLNGESTYVALAPSGAAETLPVDQNFWSDLFAHKYPVLDDGRLVALFQMSGNSANWEMHPAGEELVYLLSGSVDFVLDQAGSRSTVALRRTGDFVLVPRAIWHMAKALEPSSMLFITPGRGTEHRPVC